MLQQYLDFQFGSLCLTVRKIYGKSTKLCGKMAKECEEGKKSKVRDECSEKIVITRWEKSEGSWSYEYVGLSEPLHG